MKAKASDLITGNAFCKKKTMEFIKYKEKDYPFLADFKVLKIVCAKCNFSLYDLHTAMLYPDKFEIIAEESLKRGCERMNINYDLTNEDLNDILSTEYVKLAAIFDKQVRPIFEGPQDSEKKTKK